MKRFPFVLVLLALGLAAPIAQAEKWEEAPPPEQKLFWRNSLFTWEHLASAYSFVKSAQPTYNPYYAQSFSLRPRFYVMDDLSIRPRIDFEVELTTADDTDHARETIVSDMYLDFVWTPKFLTIPVVDIKVTPSLRFMFPTSIVSRGRSMVMLLGPGFSLRREFAFRKGSKWLNGLELGYGFRFNKYFNKYATQTIANDIDGCQNFMRPECQHRGTQNVSWRFNNTVDATLKIHDRVSLGISVMFINNLLHQLPPRNAEPLSPETPGLFAPELGASAMNHTAATWAIFDLSYDVLDWLTLSVGTSTYYGQLAADSTYRTALFNRETNFYFDVTIPVDALYTQVRKWVRPRAPLHTAEMKGASGLLANGL